MKAAKKKNYRWEKGYKYVDIPVYWFSKTFYFLGKWRSVKLFKLGTKKKRVGIKVSSNAVFDSYLSLLQKNQKI